MIVRETIQEGTLKQNKNYPIDIPKHVLDHLISSCRSHADVLNMHYICNKQKLPLRFMNDLIIRKKPLKNRDKIDLMLQGLINYCDEVEELRLKIQKIIDEIGTQDKG